MIAVQLVNKTEPKVIAVSRDNWIKKDFGAGYIISDHDKLKEKVKE